MNFRETDLGFEAETPTEFYFFGKKDASLENLQRAYPALQWSRLKQTHSDIVLESYEAATEPSREGDAHWTAGNNLALLISTADCVPVLIASEDGKVVAAIHAGWRGVANRIIPKTVEQLHLQGHKKLHAVVGPHIQQSSFEVDTDVKKQLVRASKCSDSEVVHRRNDGKFEVDLNAIVQSQLVESSVDIESLPVDTKTDLRFHSHRRDKEKAGRQLSFIYRK